LQRVKLPRFEQAKQMRRSKISQTLHVDRQIALPTAGHGKVLNLAGAEGHADSAIRWSFFNPVNTQGMRFARFHGYPVHCKVSG
jgi:S-adenosylhomocysteine hydrolase